MPSCKPRLELSALEPFPTVQPGDDLAALIRVALTTSGWTLAPCDVVVVTSKVVSRAEGRFVDLSTVTPTERASQLGRRAHKDSRLVELVLRETETVSRVADEVLIVRNHLGVVSANAGIDASNAEPADPVPGTGPWVLLLPEDPDASAEQIRVRLESDTCAPLGVVVTDSLGRPFRLGTVGAAIGVSGLPALHDHRGSVDRFGRPLEHTVTALADQVAAAADLVAGQAAEGRAVVIVRGLEFDRAQSTARQVVRSPANDLFLGEREP